MALAALLLPARRARCPTAEFDEDAPNEDLANFLKLLGELEEHHTKFSEAEKDWGLCTRAYYNADSLIRNQSKTTWLSQQRVRQARAKQTGQGKTKWYQLSEIGMSASSRMMFKARDDLQSQIEAMLKKLVNELACEVTTAGRHGTLPPPGVRAIPLGAFVAVGSRRRREWTDSPHHAVEPWECVDSPRTSTYPRRHD